MSFHNFDNIKWLDYFQINKSELFIGNITISDLIRKYETPFYSYDSSIIERNVTLLKTYFPQFEIFYSIKANPSLAICHYIRKFGIGAEVASAGELELALMAGFTSNKIIFSGPGKKTNELSLAIKNQIASINFESLGEFDRLNNLAIDKNTIAKACIRVNTAPDDVQTPEIMSGKASKFGIDENDLFCASNIKYLTMGTGVKILGIHVYVASQILNTDTILNNLSKTLSIATRLFLHEGIKIKMIVFGGGFGIPYEKYDSILDLNKLAIGIKKLFDSFAKTLPMEDIRFIIEIGRFLVANAGIFITKIIDIKTSHGKKYLITDGGMNSFFRPIFMGINHPTFVLNRLGEPNEWTVDIGGPTCTPFDIYAKEIFVPQCEPGDIIGVFNAGAYGYSMSLLDFLSHYKPQEIIIHNGKSYIIRQKTDINDILKHQLIPDEILT